MIVLYILGTIIILSFMLSVVYIAKNKKNWSCVKGICEKDTDGDYSSKSACHHHCKKASNTKMLGKVSEKNNEYSYICDNCYCRQIEGKGGDYTTLEACQRNCCDYGRHYYPQSMYLHRPWHWKRPFYWRRRHLKTP